MTQRTFRKGHCVACGGARGISEGLYILCRPCAKGYPKTFYGSRKVVRPIGGTIKKKQPPKPCATCGIGIRGKSKYCLPCGDDARREHLREKNRSYSKVKVWGKTRVL